MMNTTFNPVVLNSNVLWTDREELGSRITPRGSVIPLVRVPTTTKSLLLNDIEGHLRKHLHGVMSPTVLGWNKDGSNSVLVEISFFK